MAIWTSEGVGGGSLARSNSLPSLSYELIGMCYQAEHGRELLIGAGQGGSDVVYTPVSVALLQGALLCSLPTSSFFGFHDNKSSLWLMELAWLPVQCGLAATCSTCVGITGGWLK